MDERLELDPKHAVVTGGARHDQNRFDCEVMDSWSYTFLWQTWSHCPYCGRPLDDGFPEIVCLCGSTRFETEFEAERFRLTLDGAIVLTVAGAWKDDHDDDWDAVDAAVKSKLDELHMRKIDMADRVHVINVDGYVGESTRNEIEHALDVGADVTWIDPRGIPDWFEDEAPRGGDRPW